VDSDDSKGLYSLEATKDGVKKYTLRNRLRSWHHFFPGIKIGYRKLNCNRTTAFNASVREFVKKVEGSSYGFSISKFRLKSTIATESELKSQYFCSELVAKLFKHLQILHSEKASCTYLPRKNNAFILFPLTLW
jgi:hypothetical protein